MCHIKFKPSQGILKKFSIDFQVLSLILSSILKEECIHHKRPTKKYQISIRLVKGWYSYYRVEPGLVHTIYMSQEIKDSANFIVDLLHELRHFIQYKIIRIPHTNAMYDESTPEKYKNSPAEIDAVKYAQHYRYKVLRAYMQIKKRIQFDPIEFPANLCKQK